MLVTECVYRLAAMTHIFFEITLDHSACMCFLVFCMSHSLPQAHTAFFTLLEIVIQLKPQRLLI